MDEMLHGIPEKLSVQINYLKKCLTSLKQTCQEELRVHFLAEVLSFFPDGMLKNLQCRTCRRDKYCWRGQTQAYTCGIYFLGQYPDPSLEVRKARICQVRDAGPGTLADYILQAEFLDLLMLCFLMEINVRILSRITNYGLRTILLHAICANNSPYLLTFNSENSILSSHCITQGEINATSREIANP